MRISTYQWFPVRCCCKPLTIFGFMRLRSTEKSVEFIDRQGQIQRIELRPMVQTIRANNEPVEPIGPQVDCHEELAIYSDDRPIEFWREIPGFVEILGDR